MIAITPRRATPKANPHRVAVPRCVRSRTRGGSVDPNCTGHTVAGGYRICGCPACRAPDVLVAVAPAPVVSLCRDCGGDGYVKVSTGWRLDDWEAVPCRCRSQMDRAVA